MKQTKEIPLIIQKVLAKCEDKFNSIWLLEVERYRKLADEMIIFWGITKNPYDYYQMQHQPGVVDKSPYNFWKQKFSPKRFHDLYHTNDPIMNRVFKLGFDEAMGCQKEFYLSMLTGKLRDALNKYTKDFSDIENISVGNDVKGYIISAELLKENTKTNMKTRCISAGGYNIQCYHYRYITKLS